VESSREWIRVRGAREHNLRGIDVDLPHDALIVVTGVSGSGKSSLIYETLFRESQRRHLASMPPRIRATFSGLTRPHVDQIDGLRPAIAIQRAGVRSGPRSTVGHSTEIADFLALLYARVGDGAFDAIEPIDPRRFLASSRLGACPTCAGTGRVEQVDLGKLIPDPERSIADGAFATTSRSGYVRYSRLSRPAWHILARRLGFGLDQPWSSLSADQQRIVLYGDPWVRETSALLADFTGVVPTLEAACRRSPSSAARSYIAIQECGACGGTRFHPDALEVTLYGVTIAGALAMTVSACLDFLGGLSLSGARARIAEAVLTELTMRGRLVEELGLGYLSLDRPTDSLSGGEAQRIRLAGQVSAGISGVLYVLDEPSIGLHHRDHGRLLDVLRRLRDAGNTVCVAEHDELTIRSADYVIDMGPGPADEGGAVVAVGSPQHIEQVEGSVTGRYLRMARDGGVHRKPAGPRRSTDGPALTIRGARFRNLKNVDVRIPLRALTCVTGVSGSGKSTLVEDTLRPALMRVLTRGRSRREPGEHDSIEGYGNIARVVDIDQTPIGRSPRSNPATYTRAFDHIRATFAKVPEAQVRGFGPGHFSFNVAGGRCEACSGAGVVRVKMQYVPDVLVECEECEGKRFSRDVLRIRYHGVSIAEVLDMTASRAAEHFSAVPGIARPLRALCDVGLGYIRLGQPGTSLSGGEAQRVRLAAHVAGPRIGHTLYLLDEPTTGLHLADVERLLALLHRLVDAGNTVLVVEHHPDVMAAADHIIDLGPEGGGKGGEIVALGSPEELAAQGLEEGCRSHTARLLAGLQPITPRLREVRQSEAPPETRRAIRVLGARANNLKGIDVEIPKGAVTCITGVSGSGKSSLAFDTIYAACQNGFAQCLSSFARTALGGMRVAEATSVTGICPAVAVDRRSRVATARSTVGTVTEVVPLLRMLYARVGVRHCPSCGNSLRPLTAENVADGILHRAGAVGNGEIFAQLVAPVADGLTRRSDVLDLATDLRSAGFVRLRIDERDYNLVSDEIDLGRKRKHCVGALVDRVRLLPERRERLAESVRLALNLGGDRLVCEFLSGGELAEAEEYSTALRCLDCGVTLQPELTARSFSFNDPSGRCDECRGMGTVPVLDPDLLIPDPTRSFATGAVAALARAQYADPNSEWSRVFSALGRALGFTRDTPFCELTQKQLRVFLHGTGDKPIAIRANGDGGPVLRKKWRGLVPLLEARAAKAETLGKLRRFMAEVPCSACNGERLRPEFRAVTVGGRRIPEVWSMTVATLRESVGGLTLPDRAAKLAEGLLAEIANRLRFLAGVGLGYVELSRPITSLSAGEAQRVRLASQLGGTLSGLLYVLDEPSVGLHPHDMDSLLYALEGLKSLGNTVIAVEHDEATMSRADYLIELGPGPGCAGGHLTAAGPRDEVLPRLLADRPPLQRPPKPGGPERIEIRGARHHNLRGINVTIPLRALTCVTGVSGAGKSSLIFDTLRPALRRRLHGYGPAPGDHDGIAGASTVDRVVVVTQASVGHSAKSVPATYVGFFDAIRELFADLPEARRLGMTRAHFSFNDPKGRCRTCHGEGSRRVDMQFMADLVFPCEDCGGRRYTPDALAITYREQTIADVLDMTFDEAGAFFADREEIAAPVQAVCRAGLGYLRLGQPSPSLSGGEAQRLRLATALVRPSSEHTLYLMDEPTTGLHAKDTAALIRVLHDLTQTATVVVIEHNLDVLAAAHWIVDLGLGGGPNGGELVVEGTPKTVMLSERSVTGRYLRAHVKRERNRENTA